MPRASIPLGAQRIVGEPMAPEQLPAAWRAQADAIDRFSPAAAVAFRDAALALEQALRDAAGETLTLAEAAIASGFSADHLRHKVASGSIPNAGTKGKPRIRRGDLPKKGGAQTPTLYDVDADARRLAGGAR